MTGKWIEIAKLSFKGNRFRDHALDLTTLGELSQFQKLVSETAKTLWKIDCPGKYLPQHFDDRVRLYLRRIEDGSATAPLEVFIEDQSQTSLWDPVPTEVNEAVELAREVFEALDTNRPLPERFPRVLLPEYAKWGQSLDAGEEILLYIPEKNPARFSPLYKQELEKYIEIPHEDHVQITGEVFEADVKQRRFQIVLDNDIRISANFTTEQEDKVTTALKDHNSVRIIVKGSGEHSNQGKLLRITRIDELNLITGEISYDRSAKPIEDILEELAQEIPQNEWDRLPDDLNDNLDHYLYGVPKQ
ncbi:MAG: hypothetical protein A2161_22750 [Candidatus Schekmanbacteria bacterium RBG_13_48_7]|uniref:Uncharacterized protein n=1 Tax=Candidatus Schekmanbacteria bacterium RBG_13_48_7 TaxID=1817878 RepID=A0A1F7S265_9BACT|nr:MAG: hypothetical protein A2161_22750 [Candidatus Schekmanbacteria bacterium RBG_13_48_7]